MRKLQVRRYESETEFANDLHAVAKAVSKSQKAILALKEAQSASFSERSSTAAENFPKIIETLASLNDVLPNMSRWLTSKSHTELASETIPLSLTLGKLTNKYRKAKACYLALARAYSGKTSKKFRVFANQVKIHIDGAMSNVYRSSEFSVMLMPDLENNKAVNVAVLSYKDVRDSKGFTYPCFNVYLAESADGVEVRSSPFETFEYIGGDKAVCVSSAAKHVTQRLRSMNVKSVSK